MNRVSCFLGQMVVSGCGGVEENEICLLTCCRLLRMAEDGLGRNFLEKQNWHFHPGNLTAERYVEEVVQNHILPFAHEIDPHFVLMQAGARANASRVTTRYLEDSGIQVMDWPPHSPDLNCIEHLWDLIGRRLHNRQHQPQTLQELEDALLE